MSKNPNQEPKDSLKEPSPQQGVGGSENPPTPAEKAVSKTNKKESSIAQIDLGALKRPIKPPDKFEYFIGLHPNFKWKGSISIKGFTFEKIVHVRTKKVQLLGVKQVGTDSENMELHRKYGIVVKRTKQWFETMQKRVWSTILTMDEGRIRTRILEKPITEEDPALDLERERPLGEVVYMIPTEGLPEGFREKAFSSWDVPMMIKPLEPALV